jgi:hypothetical protein
MPFPANDVADPATDQENSAVQHQDLERQFGEHLLGVPPIELGMTREHQSKLLNPVRGEELERVSAKVELDVEQHRSYLPR